MILARYGDTGEDRAYEFAIANRAKLFERQYEGYAVRPGSDFKIPPVISKLLYE